MGWSLLGEKGFHLLILQVKSVICNSIEQANHLPTKSDRQASDSEQRSKFFHRRSREVHRGLPELHDQGNHLDSNSRSTTKELEQLSQRKRIPRLRH